MSENRTNFNAKYVFTRKKNIVAFIALVICIAFGVTNSFSKDSFVDITVAGPIIRGDGIGGFTIDIIDVLSEKYKVGIKKIDFNGSDLSPKILSILKKKNKKPGPVVIYTKPVWDLSPTDVSYLAGLQKTKDRIVVAFSMFESSLIPESGVEALNKYFNLVVVPDEYLVDVYKNSGVLKPIKVLPLPMNLKAFQKTERIKKVDDPFVFTILSSSIYRKNILGTLIAFNNVFKNNPKVRLKINSRYSANGAHHEIMRYLLLEDIKNVEYSSESLTFEKYKQILNQTDCLLSASMGEGFSLQPREAMSMGIPVIVTNNTAQTTICKTNLVKVVESRIEEPAFHYFMTKPCGSFFKCNTNDLSNAMMDVYENYEKYKQQALCAVDWVQKYDIANLKNDYIDFFNLKKLRTYLDNNN